MTISTLIHSRVQAAHEGKNPTVICKMSSGWAVLGDRQFIPGYALLLSDPVVSDVTSLIFSLKSRWQTVGCGGSGWRVDYLVGV